MDVYTFKAEFKKLVEPYIQKDLWADHLKKNLLAGSALNLVLKIDKIDKIWEKLFEVYRNTHLMLQNKLAALDNFSNLDKLRDDEKIASQISGLLNLITDLCKLAETYSLENDLYYGVGLHKILDLMGSKRERKFVESIALTDIGGKEKWKKLVDVLQTELKKREALVLHERVRKSAGLEKGECRRSRKDSSEGDGTYVATRGDFEEECRCFICGKSNDHVISSDDNGNPYIEYIACKAFAEKTCRERSKILFKKKFCNKCLTPGVFYKSDHDCDKQYACGQTFEKDGQKLKCNKHVLVCEFHCDEDKNVELLTRYKENVIKPENNFSDFTKNIAISCFSETYLGKQKDYSNLEDSKEDSIFAFQTIEISSGFKLNIFYDSGCGEAIISKEACDKFNELGHATIDEPGPITLIGVNDQESICPHGTWSISLPLKNGKNAELSGLCLDSITVPFPKYTLDKIEKDIRSVVGREKKDLLPKLPRLSKEVGGTVDVMVGKQFLKYFPREVFRMAPGLTLYDSMFQSYDGTNGVVSGPHVEFSKRNRMSHFCLEKRCFYTRDAMIMRYFSPKCYVPLLGNEDDICDDSNLVELPLVGSGTREETLPDSHTNPSSLRNGGFVCLSGDPFSGGKGVFVSSAITLDENTPVAEVDCSSSTPILARSDPCIGLVDSGHSGVDVVNDLSRDEMVQFGNSGAIIDDSRLNLVPSASNGGSDHDFRHSKEAMNWVLNCFVKPMGRIFWNIILIIAILSITFVTGYILLLEFPKLCPTILDYHQKTSCVSVMGQYSSGTISIELESHSNHPDSCHSGYVDVLQKNLGTGVGDNDQYSRFDIFLRIPYSGTYSGTVVPHSGTYLIHNGFKDPGFIPQSSLILDRNNNRYRSF